MTPEIIGCDWENDGEALDFLAFRGYRIDENFCIKGPLEPGHRVQVDERQAINYLCDEWDYQYDY